MKKNFEIRCWHINNVPAQEMDCTHECIVHCGKQWSAETLNQAFQIQAVHNTFPHYHGVKIYDMEGKEVSITN